MNLPTSIQEITTDDVVPRMSQPVWFDTTISMTRNLGCVGMWMGHYQDHVPLDTVFDEVAVMVPDPWHLSILDAYLRTEGWVKFNEAQDLVFTNPFGTRYFVEYTFYRHPNVPYRFEVMMMGAGTEDGNRGFSPLHQALWVPNGTPKQPRQDITRYPIPHISYKPKRGSLFPTREQRVAGKANEAKQTWGQAYGRAVDYLQSTGRCIHAMSCQSTYGRFGYYIGNDTARQIYVKPRVNLRDEG